MSFCLASIHLFDSIQVAEVRKIKRVTPGHNFVIEILQDLRSTRPHVFHGAFFFRKMLLNFAGALYTCNWLV